MEKYYQGLEKKEMLENKMASVMEIPTTAYVCVTVSMHIDVFGNIICISLHHILHFLVFFSFTCSFSAPSWITTFSSSLSEVVCETCYCSLLKIIWLHHRYFLFSSKLGLVCLVAHFGSPFPSQTFLTKVSPLVGLRVGLDDLVVGDSNTDSGKDNKQ